MSATNRNKTIARAFQKGRQAAVLDASYGYRVAGNPYRRVIYAKAFERGRNSQ